MRGKGRARHAVKKTDVWQIEVLDQGCHSQGKTEKFQGQGKVRENLSSCQKSVKSQGILFSGCHKVWRRL